MPTPKKNELFKQRASKLKALGIIDYDLRKTPTDYQKRRARELYNKFSEVIHHPDKFKSVIVSRKTAKAIDLSPLKTKTKTGKEKIFVKTDGKKLKVNRNHSITVGERGEDQIIHTYYKGGKGIFETAKKIFKKLPDYSRMIDEGEIDDIQSEVKKYVTVAIGDNMPFHRAMYSEAEFNFYIAEFKPNDAKDATPQQRAALKERLIQRMVTVEVYSPDAFDGETIEARKNALRIYKGEKSNGKKNGKAKNRRN